MANIPGYLDDPLSYVLEAVYSAVGEGTTPIHMSVNEKDIEEDPDNTKSVLFKSKNELQVSTGKGALALIEIQLEGKKRMPMELFLRGFSIEEGDVLG